MPDQDRRQRLGAALLCLGCGLALAYVAWAAPVGLRAPRSVIALAATTFGAAGATVLLQLWGYGRAQAFSALLMGIGLTAVSGWVAFGSGPRPCHASLGGLGLVPPELGCRVAFGVGTMMMAGVVLLMLRAVVGRKPKPPEHAA